MSPRLFSRIIVLWLFLTFYLVQWQSSAFAIYRATRPNVLYRSNLASSNPVACLGKAKPTGIFSLDDLSNSGPAVRQDSEGWELGPPEDRYIKGGILSYPAGNLCGGVREWASSYSE
jgi:hypothetical protein